MLQPHVSKNPLLDLNVFLLESLRSFSVTASLFPSSRALSAALLRSIDFSKVDVVLELGMGTGAVTTEILRRLSPHGRLFAVDVNPAFVSHVRRSVPDPRLVPVLGTAERLGPLLNQRGIRRVDAIVSSLGLALMTPQQRSRIFEQAAGHLHTRGILSQYQYLHSGNVPRWCTAFGLPGFSEEDFLREYFRDVRSERVIWNLPPASVFTCRP